MELSLTENERAWLCEILAHFSTEYPRTARKFKDRLERDKHIQEVLAMSHSLLDKVEGEDTDEAF